MADRPDWKIRRDTHARMTNAYMEMGALKERERRSKKEFRDAFVAAGKECTEASLAYDEMIRKQITTENT